MKARRASRLAWLFAAACFAFTLAAAPVRADETPRDQARQHAQTGEARFRAQDYRGAIEAFRAADALVPSPILTYNIALAHEKLGEDEQAIQLYQEYLTRRPEAPNRAQIETRMKELGDKVAAKQAAEAEAKAAAEAAAKAAAAQAEQDLYREVDAPEPEATTPAAATATSSAPGQLAPMNAVDEGLARRFPSRTLATAVTGGAPGAVAPGAAEPGAAEPTAPSTPAPGIDATAPELAQASAPAAPPTGPAEQAPSPDAPPPGPLPEPAQDQPLYTKWWFWGVVGVGAIILISAIADGDDSGRTENASPPNTVGGSSGAILFSF